MHQARLVTALLQNLLDTVFFAKILLADKLDLHAIRLIQRLCIRSQPFLQGLCKAGVIKDANSLLIQISHGCISQIVIRQIWA